MNFKSESNDFSGEWCITVETEGDLLMKFLFKGDFLDYDFLEVLTTFFGTDGFLAVPLIMGDLFAAKFCLEDILLIYY